jgi:uncharacterized membrane protein YtjA (UPF0391 family)
MPHSIERSQPCSFMHQCFWGSACLAAALNFAGVTSVAVQISGILFLMGIVLVAIHVVTGFLTQVA